MNVPESFRSLRFATRTTSEAIGAPSAAEVTPSELSRDQINLNAIDEALPRLMSELAVGKTHRFNGLAPRRMIASVIAEDVEKGLKSAYFKSPENLARFVGEVQNTLPEQDAREVLVTGALMVSKRCHHAAVVGLIKKHEAALMVLDSIPDLGSGPRVTIRPSRLIAKFERQSGANYDGTTFQAFRDLPNTSVYYTYLGTQSSMTDCAAFTISSARKIAQNVDELNYYHSILAQRAAHVANAKTLPPGLSRAVNTANTAVDGKNTNFVLNGEKFISPIHYVNTQSETALKRYCAVSPFVKADPGWKDFLLEQHRQHRRNIRPLFSVLPRLTARKANIAIRQEQIHALIETRAAISARIAAHSSEDAGLGSSS